MRHRIFRSAIGLAIVLVAYSAYALVAVPLIEPAARKQASGAAAAGQVALARAGNARYAKLFERYFPPDHWAHDNPKVLESGQAMLLLKDYRSLGGGRMELVPCVVLIFPEREDPQESGRGAIVLDAPQGAVLQFDENFDLAQARLGKLRHGQLVGPITVHSDMREPGPEDDLHIVTRDVQMTQSRVWTEAHVEFRVGASRGQGEQMEIRLLPGGSNNAVGVNVGGLQSFQLARDVKMHLEMEQSGPLPDGEKPTAATDEKPQPPVEITCRGPFHFDMTRYVATFEDQVDVLRLNPDGPSDQLTCELLSIYFQPQDGTRTATAAKGKPPKLRPARIEARGDPVVARSPSTVGEVRCQRLEYNLITRKISLEGDDRVMLRQGPSRVECAAVHYQPDADPNRLGTLWAKGPGELRVASEKDPSQVFKAYWQRELHLRRYQGAPVVSLLGRPRLEAAGNGALTADEVHLWLLEPPPGGASQGRPTQTAQVRPDRLLAQGNVAIDSPQLTGATKRLEVWFRQAAETTNLAARANASQEAAPARNIAAARGRLAPPPLLPTDREQQQQPPKQTFAVEGDLVRMQLLMRGRAADLSDLTIDGHVVLRETRTAKPDEKPLVIRGDRLQMAGAEDQLAHVTVNGQPARVEARGMTMQGAAIDLDQESNRLWINGAGSMSMPANRDLQGRPVAGEQRMTVTWQGQMQFDGRTAQFQRQVVGRGPSQVLHTELLEAELQTPIRFAAGGPRPGADRPELLEVRCRQGLRLENRELEGDRQISIDRMELASLRINRVTGEIAGEGPGWLTTVRVGGGNPLAGPASPQPQRAAGADLDFLRVDFTRALTGNIHRRQVSFVGNVRSVYGPVPNWSQVVDVNGPAGLGEQGVLLDCDRLTVTEMNSPARRGSHIELEALGNTLVEGRDFTARAHRMAYTQAKELLVLEGSGHTEAQLWRQTQVGGPSSRAAARKILYWRNTNRVEVDDARYLDLSQFGDAK